MRKLFAFISALFVLPLAAQDAGAVRQLQKLTQVYRYLDGLYVDEVDMQPLVESAISGMLEELDPHSAYIGADEMKGVQESFEGEFSGIGVEFNILRDTVIVVNTIVGGPAERVGVQPNDRIVRIDTLDAVGFKQTDVPKYLRGKTGTKVEIDVVRQGEPEPLHFVIVRDKIPLNTVDAAYMAADGVGYIKVNRFGRTTMPEFREAYRKLGKPGALILDLRGNGGGLIDVAFKIANAMTPDKGVTLAGVRYRDDMGGLDETVSTGGGLPLNKIVVLVNGGTASAAELLTGILQDTAENVTVVGEKTYGKGQGQFHIDLVNGDKLVITTLELELPKQGCWEGVGLTPDIQLENRKVTVNTKDLKPLNTSTTLRFGDSSDAVYAMTERLSLLGLLTEATGRYDGDVADAVASFRAAYDLPAALYASPEMLSALDEAVTALNGQTYLVDDQLQSALEMCRLAAAKPQQYTVKSDGSWTKK